ncbi:MAG: MerR family transcriptional regulator [Desulforhabdus sp.]|jgi:DNA-binding transcriptional MerR regulator|nr:MerR family transcriptional regulator [Desulforhabdus sp.]
MKNYTISKLAGEFGLSRSALLYYDRIGLLPPSGRTPSGYRYYTDEDHIRLDRICNFRQAGLTLEEIRAALESNQEPSLKVLEHRLKEIDHRIRDLRNQQKILAGMTKAGSFASSFPSVTKEMWVEMLQAAGMEENAMHRWHAEFERRTPEAHRDFLIYLGIPAREVLQIRKWAAGFQFAS